MKHLEWRALIDGMIESVLIVDAIEFRVLEANREATLLFGSAREELISTPIVDLAVTPEDLCFWEDVAAGVSDHIFSETLVKHRDGHVIQADRRVTRMAVDGGTSVFVVSIRDQSDQRRVEDELERLIAELRATLESTADGILVTDLSDGIRGYNSRFAELWALPHDMLTVRDDRAVFDWLAQASVDRNGYLARLAAISRTPLLETTDVIALRSGTVLERVTMPQYARGRAIGRVFSFRDITEQLANHSRLELAAKVFESSIDGIFIVDQAFAILTCNRSGALLAGHDQQALSGRPLGDLLYTPDDDKGLARVLEQFVSLGVWEGEIWYRKACGSGAPGLVSLIRVRSSSSSTEVPSPHGGSESDSQSEEGWQCVVFLKDLSERHAANQRIEELAYNDALTGLPNRILLTERIQYALSLAAREHRSLAILFLDLDRFKQINDSLGHQFGDRVLIEVSQRIQRSMREADTAARLGGDEFVLLLNDCDVRSAETAARRILAALSEPLELDGMQFAITCSIGIALYPQDGDSMDELIKNADTAMYRVKERGRSDFRFYQRQMNIDLLSRMKLEQSMRRAIEQGGFVLHYQPQIALGDRRVIGAEALLRWFDPELGCVSPGRFIPVAEESGLIIPLGDWVLHEAVCQARYWLDHGLNWVVAVNVSALQFQQSNFVNSVRSALESVDLPADRLELELTESILVQDAQEALTRLYQLADLGVKISIDDFGTGYSSLSYLKRFPIQKLKIDRSFVCGLPDDESDVAIVSAIIHLGHALHLQVIAEGVETSPQQGFLRDRGCNEFQGFLCAPALSPSEFEQRFSSMVWTQAPDKATDKA